MDVSLYHGHGMEGLKDADEMAWCLWLNNFDGANPGGRKMSQVSLQLKSGSDVSSRCLRHMWIAG